MPDAKDTRECRPFFVKSPNGTWEDINESIEPLVGTYPYVGRENGKTYLNSITCDGIRGGKIYDVKPNHKEDMIDVMAYSSWIEEIIEKTFNDLQKEEFRKRFEHPLTPKSIEQSADHKTVCVLWQDGSKTIVKLSDNDKDDIDTAFAYALAKKIFGTNTHLKKVVRQKLNEHKPKPKKLPSDPNPKEIPIEFEYVKAAKELFLEAHLIYDVQISIDLMDTGETRVHMYNSREGMISYIKNVESTQDALREIESMWQEFNTEKEAEDATGR